MGGVSVLFSTFGDSVSLRVAESPNLRNKLINVTFNRIQTPALTPIKSKINPTPSGLKKVLIPLAEGDRKAG